MTVSVLGWGGINEIGGNKILLKDKKLNVLLDFGMSFDKQEEYFNDFLKARAARGIQDPLLLGILPPLEGIYRKGLETESLWQLLRNRPDYCNFSGQTGSLIDAVLLSHAHLDHIGDLGYLEQEIPVYLTTQSAVIARVLQMTGMGNIFEDYTYVKAREMDENGFLKIDRKGKALTRPLVLVDQPPVENPALQEFWTGLFPGSDEDEIKALKIDYTPSLLPKNSLKGHQLKHWRVDHSIPGSCAFALETEKGWLGYTGDLRFQGSLQEETYRYAREMAQLKPYALLCEGTHTESTKAISEEQIYQNALVILQKYHGRLAFADFAFKNLDRLATFLRLAAQTSRKLLVQPKTLFLIWAISLTDDNFKKIYDQAALALFDDPKTRLKGWEKFIRNSNSQRTYDFHKIDENPGGFLYMCTLNNINDLLDLQKTAGGVYLYSNSKAYDDEQKADLVRLRNWLAYLQLDFYGDPEDPQAAVLHTSGHAIGSELAAMVQEINPRFLVPIHTEHPEWWADQLKNTTTKILYPQPYTPLIIA